MHHIFISTFILLFSFPVFSEPAPVVSEANPIEELSEQQEYEIWAAEIWQSLNKQTGVIAIEGVDATITVPDNYIYLNAQDAEEVLTRIWDNPPSDFTLGMLLPANIAPMEDNSWAVSIEYDEKGYVSDEDAADTDYDDLLQQMKDSTAEDNEWREEEGYEPITLMGWAADPAYDAQAHKVSWAKELKFGNDELNILNYNIRILGRQGVLELDFIASMSQLDTINSELDTVSKMVEFNEGSRYSDFNPDTDIVAEDGVGSLVSGLPPIAELGILAAILLFVKKFFVVIVIAIGGFFKALSSRKKKKGDDD